MPCYNAGKFLSESIESVINQSYDDWELIVVDDGSKDDSLKIAKEYESDKVKVIAQSNSGACVARNRGISEARGEYIKFLDADDILDKDCLKNQIEQIASLNSNQIPFGDYDYIDSEGKSLRSFTFEMEDELKADRVAFFYSRWQVLITCPLHRKCLLEKIGGFDESFKRGQEADLHLRLALADVEFVHFPCHTFSYREHNSTSKITNNYSSGAISRAEYWLHRQKKCEKMFIEKYGSIPSKYLKGCASFWFDRAREAYAAKDSASGDALLKKSFGYGAPMTSFQKVYRIFGGRTLEPLFQLRLKLVGKK